MGARGQLRPGGRVVVACDKFKGSLTASQVAAAITTGLHAEIPELLVDAVLVADGGDGTLDAAVAAGFSPVPVTVAGPTGEPVRTAYAVKDGEAVVEMADACGLVRLPGGVLHPLTSSSRGLGEVIAAALDDARVTRLRIGIGGSATTDGGAGMLAALGARLCDGEGRPVPDGGGGLADLVTVDLGGLHPRLGEVEVIVACDVTNPLLGSEGAAAVFGPQKGATPQDVALLDRALGELAASVTRVTGRDDSTRPGAGAAGGVGYAAMAALGAHTVPGVEFVLELVGFDQRVGGADLVITGEGSLDKQTLLGKTPAGVAAAARRHQVATIAVCGRALLDPDDLTHSGIEQVYALLDIEPDPQVCMGEASRLLTELVRRVARERARPA